MVGKGNAQSLEQIHQNNNKLKEIMNEKYGSKERALLELREQKNQLPAHYQNQIIPNPLLNYQQNY